MQVEHLELENATLKDENESSVSNLKDAKYEINQIQSELDTAKVQLSTTEKLKKEARTLLATVTEKLETTNCEIESLKAQLRDQEAVMSKLQNEQVR